MPLAPLTSWVALLRSARQLARALLTLIGIMLRLSLAAPVLLALGAAAQSDIRWFSDSNCNQLATIPGGVAEFTNMTDGECTEEFGTALDGVSDLDFSWGGFTVSSSFLYLCGGVNESACKAKLAMTPPGDGECKTMFASGYCEPFLPHATPPTGLYIWQCDAGTCDVDVSKDGKSERVAAGTSAAASVYYPNALAICVLFFNIAAGPA